MRIFVAIICAFLWLIFFPITFPITIIVFVLWVVGMCGKLIFQALGEIPSTVRLFARPVVHKSTRAKPVERERVERVVTPPPRAPQTVDEELAALRGQQHITKPKGVKLPNVPLWIWLVALGSAFVAAILLVSIMGCI